MTLSESGDDGLGSTEDTAVPSIVMIDRMVDMVTPMLTQLTYEGLVDEMLGVKSC